MGLKRKAFVSRGTFGSDRRSVTAAKRAHTHLFAASKDIAKRLPEEKNYNSG
jgi:hypothetical protein